MTSTVDEIGALSVPARRQRQMLERCACPQCGGALEIESEAEGADGLIARGRLLCTGCSTVVDIQDYQIVALPQLVRAEPGLPDAAVRVELESEALMVAGPWRPVGFGHVGLHENGSSAALEYTGRFDGVEIAARSGDWSGVLRVSINGVEHHRHDLYSTERGFATIRVANPGGAGTLRIDLTERPNPQSHGNQMIIDRVAIFRPADTDEVPAFAPIARGNPHPARFFELVAAAADDAFIVDCGGGERRIGDPRVFNLEYGRATAVDIVADCERIPLADGTVDVLLSQAVLEHVQHPADAAAEIMRVLKPGGVAFIEVAYMQPFHPVPDHYFNHTPSALRLLFTGMEIVAESTFGTLADTMSWLGQLAIDRDPTAGAAVAHLVEAARGFDAIAAATVSRHFASAAAIEVRKPI